MSVETESALRLEDEVRSLCRATSAIEDPMWMAQLRLAAAVLANSCSELVRVTNARTVSDFEFALNDLAAGIAELVPEDQSVVKEPLALVSRTLEVIRTRSRLDRVVIESLRRLEEKIRARVHAIERETYRPPESASGQMPNEPATLRGEAEALRDVLRENGFDTPMLDQLIDEPASMRLRQLADLVDELDVIAR